MQEGDGRRDILVPFYIGGDNFKCFYAIFRSLALILGFLLILGFKRNFRPVLSRGKIALARVLTLFCMSFCCQHIYTRVRKQGGRSYQQRNILHCSNTGDREEEIVVQYNLGDSMTFCFVRSQVLPGPEKISLRRPTTSLY